jgi:hypothetical protein
MEIKAAGDDHGLPDATLNRKRALLTRSLPRRKVIGSNHLPPGVELSDVGAWCFQNLRREATLGANGAEAMLRERSIR